MGCNTFIDYAWTLFKSFIRYVGRKFLLREILGSQRTTLKEVQHRKCCCALKEKKQSFKTMFVLSRYAIFLRPLQSSFSTYLLLQLQVFTSSNSGKTGGGSLDVGCQSDSRASTDVEQRCLLIGQQNNRKTRSNVWGYFGQKYTVGGNMYAACKLCKKVLSACNTTNLKSHLTSIHRNEMVTDRMKDKKVCRSKYLYFILTPFSTFTAFTKNLISYKYLCVFTIHISFSYYCCVLI